MLLKSANAEETSVKLKKNRQLLKSASQQNKNAFNFYKNKNVFNIMVTKLT